MNTTHTLHIGDARDMSAVPDASVHLIITSPPYPMIEMWDAVFGDLVPQVRDTLEAGRGMAAFELMHTALDAVWRECHRTLAPGGFACINIGDATRSLGGEFCLYPNHVRIVTAMMRLGMTPLPDILWRKPTNAPNKFMGSGMLPAGAYVTYEHEYILVVRKGGKRLFTDEEKVRRGQSAYFWEERNQWFSDLWSDLKGTGQRLGQDGLRERSAAFPFELPYRLVNMFSMYGDTVLDPFAGTGTTMGAALASGRGSIGYERVGDFQPVVFASLAEAASAGRHRTAERLAAHDAFVKARVADGKEFQHSSNVYGFPVITRQEAELRLAVPTKTTVLTSSSIVAEYDTAQPSGPSAGGLAPPNETSTGLSARARRSQKAPDVSQGSLFPPPLRAPV